ncbi:acyltransferase [Kribbella jejuensis]|uniref:Peptidoglycan/LPS O-acetylase OafA/YrhL n=1 Tax=Kribbella jejuensis TaxID=236068 RepID=A0A542EAC8_9ACTN|nr:acyltransferase [Kribbella jejuensis]TQJ12271.1 peptidoglycan/LPS O-acetylase OafA/YrhL [Kribbella jejuensis]
MEPTRGRLHEVDLLRIFAAVAVMGYHYLFSAYAGGLSGLRFPHVDVVARYGYLGVDLFFTISGFVVLLSAWDRGPRSFLVSRAVRLYPAYWVAVTLTALVSVAFSQGRFPVTLPQYLANLTMFNSLPNIQNVDVVYWTLWAELRFYAMILVLTWIGITARRVTIFCWAWLTATVIHQAGLLPHATDLVLNTQFAHYFIAGMALCLIHRYGVTRQRLAIVAISLGNAIYRGIGFADRVGIRYHTAIHRPVVVAIIVAIFAVMLAIALKLTHRLGRPWFAVLGALTYPLYLVHAHVGFIIFERLGDQVNHVLLVAATMLLMVGVAAALHYGVERPLAPRLKRLLSRPAQLVVR